MNYLHDVEFWDWLMWVKVVPENEWLEATEEVKAAWYKEFKESKRR